MAELRSAKRTLKPGFSNDGPNGKCARKSKFGGKPAKSYVKNRVALIGTIWHVFDVKRGGATGKNSYPGAL